MSQTKMLLVVALSFLLCPKTNGQQVAVQSGSVDNKMLPSPNGNTNSGSVYAPDLFNGTANVTIPIYSYGNEGISLSYNTAGVKLDEPSGMVGLHWNLSAGGSIVRSLKDMPDEINRYTYPVSSFPATGGEGGGSGEYFYGVKGRFCQYFSGATSPDYENYRYNDTESDDFVLSVGGLSFTFNIGQNGFIYTHPHKNVRIEMLINGVVINGNPVSQIPLNNNAEQLSFRVRDAQGNWYYFMKGDVSRRTYGDPDAPDLDYSYISKWVIQKIIKNDGLEIDFSYTIMDNSENLTGTYMSFSAYEKDGAAPFITASLVKSNDMVTSFARLATIKYPNGVTATFVYTPDYYQRCDCLPPDPNYPSNKGDQILRQIWIGSEDAKTRYVFQQAYSLAVKNNSSIPLEIPLGNCYDVDGSNSSSNPTNYRYHRLILKGIHMANSDSTKIEPYYSFRYNNQVRLPAKFSGSQDYFGYYNGASVTENDGMRSLPSHVPRYGSTSTSYGVNKNENVAYAVAGILDTVINAYGSLTLFSYEAHQLSNVVSNAGMTLPTDPYFMGSSANDGVRLASIKTIDPKYPGKYILESFSYIDGQRFMPGGYFDFPIYTYNPSSAHTVNHTHNTMFNGTFISPHQFINGSNHGYSIVISTTTSDAGQLSKKNSSFKNISRSNGNTSYFHSGTKKYYEAPFTDKQYIKDWEIGLLLSVVDYDQYDRTISKTTNYYDTVTDYSSTSGYVDNIKKLSTSDGYNLDIVAQENYHPYSGISLLSKSVVEKYISNFVAITDTVFYEYDSRNNLVTTTTRNSKGEYFRTENIFNYNVSGTGVPYGNQTGTTLYNMTNDGLEIRIGMERWKLNNVNVPYNNKVTDANIIRYQYQNGKLWPQKVFSLTSNLPVSYPNYTGMSMGSPITTAYGKILTAYNTNQTPTDFQVGSEVLQFNAKGSPLESQLKGQDAYQATLWDINGNKAAIVKNAHVNDVGFTSFESTIYGASYTGSENIVNGGFTYKHGGLFLSDPVTGKATFRLTFTGPNKTVTTPILTSGKDYVMTFWAKGGKPRFKGAGLLDVDYIKIYTVGDWSCYEARFNPTTTDAMVIENHKGGFMYVDEIRLFPAGAEMVNSVYAPLVGITSSTNAQGRITYYQYDAFGRSTIVKDQEGKIVSKKEYNVAQ